MICLRIRGIFNSVKQREQYKVAKIKNKCVRFIKKLVFEREKTKKYAREAKSIPKSTLILGEIQEI